MLINKNDSYILEQHRLSKVFLNNKLKPFQNHLLHKNKHISKIKISIPNHQILCGNGQLVSVLNNQQ